MLEVSFVEMIVCMKSPPPPPHLPALTPPPLPPTKVLHSAPHNTALLALQMFMGVRVNGVSSLFFGRGPSASFPNIVTLRLQHANSVYN